MIKGDRLARDRRTQTTQWRVPWRTFLSSCVSNLELEKPETWKCQQPNTHMIALRKDKGQERMAQQDIMPVLEANMRKMHPSVPQKTLKKLASLVEDCVLIPSPAVEWTQRPRYQGTVSLPSQSSYRRVSLPPSSQVPTSRQAFLSSAP